MAYQLSRPAANRAAYSDRMTNVGNPHDTLKLALLDAYGRSEFTSLTVTDTATGQVGRVHRLSYVNGPMAGVLHVSLDLPAQWVETLLGDA
jgi:hypothetical protein